MKPKIIGVGELLWDAFPSGARMGGAPANFACHAAAFGAEAAIVSRVGPDEAGAGLIRELEALGVSTGAISHDRDHATGRVDVALDGHGQPHYVIRPDSAWDHLQVDPGLLRTMEGADAICFGTLAQRSPETRAAILRLVASTPEQALRIFDINLRQDYFSAGGIRESLDLANVLKISDGELPVVAGMLDLGETVRDQLEALRSRFQLRLIAYTRGASGSLLWDGEEWTEHPGLPTEVKDTVGAGDSFTAVVAIGLLRQWSPEKISQIANEVASHVCSCVGAIPPMPEDLLRHFLQDAAERVESLAEPEAGRPQVPA